MIGSVDDKMGLGPKFASNRKKKITCTLKLEDGACPNLPTTGGSDDLPKVEACQF